MRRNLALSVFLVVTTLTVYGPAVRHDFVNFDDDDYVINNPHVRNGLKWESVIWAFTTMKESNWHPLTWLSHQLDCQLFGLNAGYHHLVNILFHVLNSLLLYMILWRMTGALWRSAMVAALFALHPLHVESVVWVSERKDVLSTLFLMLTLWAYERYAVRPCLLRYGLVSVFLALGLMAKPMLVTVPFILLLLDYWPLGRFPSRKKAAYKGTKTTPHLKRGNQESSVPRLIVEKVPLIALVTASSFVTYVAQHRGGSMSSTALVPAASRAANALVTYIAYIGKMLWPSRLAVFYPYRDTLPTPQWVSAAVALVLTSVAILWASQRRRYLTVGWLWYLGTLMPVIGLVQVGQQSMADRYTYVPLIGLFIIAVWGMADLAVPWKRGRVALVLSAGVVIVGCMVGTWFQVGHWRNGVTLFEHALKVTKPNALSHDHLGIALMAQGKLDEALPHYEEALRINPEDAYAHGNLGVALMAQGKLDEALPHYKEALRINPEDAFWHQHLGVLLAQQDSLDEAVRHFRKALAVDCTYPEAHRSLALTLANQGKHEEAIEHYREAIRLNPGDWNSYNNLAWIRATDPDSRLRNGAEAVRLAERACELLGEKEANLLDTLAAAYAEAGRFPEAIATLEEAISLATSVGAEQQVPEFEIRLKGYQVGRPYRTAHPTPEGS